MDALPENAEIIYTLIAMAEASKKAQRSITCCAAIKGARLAMDGVAHSIAFYDLPGVQSTASWARNKLLIHFPLVHRRERHELKRGPAA